MQATLSKFFWLLLFPLIISANPPKICLTLVLSDQKDEILSCLHSTKNIIDCLSVCVDESKSEIVRAVEQFAQDHKIPCKIHHFHRRNSERDDHLLINSAKKAIQEFNLSLEDTYLFLLEPNQTVHILSSFSKEDLFQDAYCLPEKISHLVHFEYRPHLFRASSSFPAFVTTKMRSLMIDTQENPQKSKESAILLQKTVKSHQKTNLLTLAESLQAIHEYEEAISYYLMRIAQGDLNEEVWLAKFMLGQCYQDLGEWESAVYWYLESYQQQPHRPEPIQRISTYYRHHGQNDLAYFFAKFGSKMPLTEEVNLHPSPPFLDYQFDEDLSIVSYYTNFREEGLLAANRLVLRKNVSGYIRDQAYRNMLFYLEPLKHFSFHPIEFELPLIELGYDETYHPMNPSLLRTENGYKVICRGVNYTQKGAKDFKTIDARGIFRNKNYLLDYSKNFTFLSQAEIIEDLPRERIYTWVQGLEDCRLFLYGKRLCCTCTTGDTNPTGAKQISFCKLADHFLYENGNKIIKVEQLTPFLGPDMNRTEKNWLPFVQNNQLFSIYSYDPLIVHQPSVESGICETVISSDSPYNFTSFRGSAGPIPFGAGYLVLVHEVVFQHNYERCYLHRFVYLDSTFRITKTSNPFIFKHLGIEFCCSMSLDHTDKNLVLTIGIEDKEAYFATIDVSDVQSLLTTLPSERKP
jgi:tetratricopeptide (TPR) repeat protein